MIACGWCGEEAAWSRFLDDWWCASCRTSDVEEKEDDVANEYRVPIPHPNGGTEEVLVELRDDVVDELQCRVSDLYAKYGYRVPTAFDAYLGPVEWMSLVESRETDRRTPPEEVELGPTGDIRLIHAYFQRFKVHCHPGTADGIHFGLPADMCLQAWARTRADRAVRAEEPLPPPPPAPSEGGVLRLDAESFRWWSQPANQRAWLRAFGVGELFPTAAPDSHPLYEEKHPKAED